MSEKLSYVQLQSSVNPSFWNKLTELKLDVDKLSEEARNIWGYFTVLNQLPFPCLEVDSTSFNKEFNAQNVYLPFVGQLFNKNTIEQFKECSKVEILDSYGNELLAKIKNNDAVENPSILNCFLVLSFADLKKYHYYYWFAFPVPKSITIDRRKCMHIADAFDDPRLINSIYDEYQRLNIQQKAYFIIERTEGNIAVHTLACKIKEISPQNVGRFYFAFHNISHNTFIGSQLRNYAALLLHHCPFLEGISQNFIAFQISRENGKICCTNSEVLELVINKTEDELKSWVGWEKDNKEKMCPRMANMKSTLDPHVLSENAVDLNLKLMKWRIMPDIDLEKIKNTKCLLLGSGTLGCSVARTLLGWGVRHITFVDNSTVSFSNPVRQSLFTYEDSVKTRPKALAAADNLKKIFPGVHTKGVELSIPMPGHSVGDSLLEQTKKNVDILLSLMREHDVIFLLMDSRESRWLPTMFGVLLDKVVINAALGFDTYLVMRHGLRKRAVVENPQELKEPFKAAAGSELGCYFCSDVTAPGNSTRDRTLDQQCTVTRPGVSGIAGSLAAELAVSLTQHPEGANAPAFYKTSQQGGDISSDIDDRCVLGLVPHTIRGFLSNFQQIVPTTLKHDNCIACSELVLQEYEKNGMDFLLGVFNSSKYLEDVAGLSEMFKDIQLDEILEFSDEESM